MLILPICRAESADIWVCVSAAMAVDLSHDIWVGVRPLNCVAFRLAICVVVSLLAATAEKSSKLLWRKRIYLRFCKGAYRCGRQALNGGDVKCCNLRGVGPPAGFL